MADSQSNSTSCNDERSLIRETLQEAVSTAKIEFRDDIEELSILLNNCAEQFRQLRMFEDAKPLYQEAIQLRRDNALIDVTFAQFLHNFSFLYLQTDELELAGPIQEESLRIFRDLLPKNHRLIAESVNNLASYYYKAGDLQKARELYQESLQIKSTYTGRENKDNYAISLANLTDLEIEVGKSAAAKTLMEQLEEASTTGASMEKEQIGRLYKEALVHSRLGNYSQAEAIIYKVQSMLRAENKINSEEYIRTQVELAGIKSEQKKFGEAETLLVDCIECMRKGENWLPEDLPTTLNNLGLLYINTWKYQKAQQVLAECIELRKKSIGENHNAYLTSLNNLALAYLHTANREKAEELFVQVLAGRKKILYENHPEIAQSMFNLGMVYMETGRHEQALEIIEKQFQIEDNVMKDVFSVSSEQERLAYSLKLREFLNTFLLQVMNLLNNNPKAILLAFDLVLRRKGIVVEALKADRIKALSHKASSNQEDFIKLNNLREQISRAVLDGPADNNYASHIAFIDKLQEEKRRVESSLARELNLSVSDFFLNNVNRHTIAKSLPEDSVLIEILKWDLEGSANLLANSGLGRRSNNLAAYSAFVLPGGEADNVQMFHFGLAESQDGSIGMETAIYVFRSAITSDPLEPDLSAELSIYLERGKIDQNKMGVELRKILIDRIKPAFGGRKKLFIAPDGVLNRLPFEVLPLNDGGYLCDEFSISYLSSGREIVHLETHVNNHQSNRSIVIANPAFNLSISANDHQKFSPLYDTEEEGEWIADELNAIIWKGDQALESVLKKCRSPRILHIATHGFFFPEGEPLRIKQTNDKDSESKNFSIQNPMLRSGIVLAGANDWLNGKALPVDAEDGLLTAEDVCAMDLLGTRLVVLSACETGLGQYHSGEGIFGLRRAFELAGAHSLVMSLWKVPTGPTKVLMKEFYRQLLAGRGRVDALQNAKATLRRRFPEVFYWGGFVLSGDIGPIDFIN